MAAEKVGTERQGELVRSSVSASAETTSACGCADLDLNHEIGE